jgi:hypothetical protein
MAAIGSPLSKNLTGLPARVPKLTGFVQVLNRNATAVLLAITGLYFLITLTQANLRLLWFDELVTFYIAKLNSLGGIWRALASGSDPNPPLSHALVMWSTRLFGDNAMAVRIPAILASWMGLVCLYAFLRKRVPVVYAAAGAFFFMATAAFDYSYEGRSYPLMLGFAMLSLLAWRWTVEGSHRYWSAALLAAALAGGISSNYFAVLAFFPIAAGELYRNIDRRKLELRVWVALAVGGLPLLFYLPLINHAINRFSPHAWNKPRIDVIADSYTEMIEYVLIPALIIFGLAVLAWMRQRRTARQLLAPDPLPRHEAVAVFVNLLYPFLGYAIAVARAGMISPRFLIPMCFGFAISVSVLSYRLFSRSQTAAVVILTLFFAWVMARESFVAHAWLEQREAFERVQQHLPNARTVAVTDSLLSLPLYFYSKPEVARRLVFPVDFEAIHRYKGEDSPEQNLWAGRNFVFPLPIVPLTEFEQSTPNFLIVTTKDNWILWRYAVQGRAPRLLPILPRAGNIGGFTPLSHGEPFYFAKGQEVDSFYASKPAGGARR